MTTIIRLRTQSMKHLSLSLVLLLVLIPWSGLSAQESAAGGQADSSTSTNAMAHPGLLSPSTTTTVTSETKPAPAEMSDREIQRAQQQAIIRRQELIFQANQALATAQKAELAAQYPEARKDYLFAAEAYGSITRSTISYAKAAEGLTRVDFQIYDAALKVGDMARAKMLMDEVVKYNPNNKLALEKQAAINRAVANPNDTTLLGNPAITPGFVNKVNEVQQLFSEAEQFRRTGQWDEAIVRLKHILGIDPYNIAATKELERIDKEKYDYAEKARLETRDERLREVEEKWYEPINNREINAAAQEAQPSLVAATNFNLDQKLKNIFVSVDFSGNTIEEATNILSVESKRLDNQDHKGINFIIDPNASTSAKPITLTLNNVPLGEALRYVCQIAGVKFKVQDYAISIVPFNANLDDLISRTFNVQPNFVTPPAPPSTDTGTVDTGAGGGGRRPVPQPAAAPVAAQPAEGSGDAVRDALVAKGIKFPPGSSAVYNSTTGQLVIVNTADQMDLIEELVNAGQAPTLMVRVAAKFVEINQQDLNDLTVNSSVGFLASGLPNNKFVTTSSYSSALPGSGGFSPDSIDQLITPRTLQPGFLSMRGFISSVSYNVLFTALSQKRSFDLLSEPAVLVKSGEQATFEAIRVFPYPVAFDPPELVQVNNNNNLVLVQDPPTIVPSTPTEFKTRNVGVRLVANPQVAADNKTVSLSLFPEVTDFEGFINYGSEVNVANPTTDILGADITGEIDRFSLLSTNDINQPVFNTRRINTKVMIRDGSTVVLGGLIREDVQTINDKVPFLGDLPLVGRLFQSKAIENTKRNLIIFVTANIYRNDGELLNPPELANAADVLTGRASSGTP